jgi:opacity protein-like surface antigen
MKKIVLLAFSALLIFSATNLSAQKNVPAPMYLGGQVILSMPMGDFGDGADMGFGLAGLFNYYFTPQVLLNAQIGYISWSTDVDDFSISNVPVTAGVHYEFKSEGFTPYIGGELGLNFFSMNYPDEYEEYITDDSETKFGLGLIGGILIPLSKGVDFRGQAKINIIEDANTFEISGGVRFAL